MGIIISRPTAGSVSVVSEQTQIEINRDGVVQQVVSENGIQPYLHTQNSLSDTWIVNHNRGQRMTCQVYDLAWNEVVASIEQVTVNQVRVTFGSPATGYVLLS